MGKRRNNESQNTRILFTKSNQTVLPSRAAVGSSGLHIKSGVLRTIRKKSITQQQTEGKVLKKDLSIETDLCVLRRYYKNKSNRNSMPLSETSRYFEIVDGDVETIEDFPQDSRASRDSRGESYEASNNIQLDITKMMMDNLQGLLIDWIKSYNLENRETKDKIETALYSIIHKTEYGNSNTANSSRSMCLSINSSVIRDIKKRSGETSTKYCRYCKSIRTKPNKIKMDCKTSCQTMPDQSKQTHDNYRIISTLSIPRNVHRKPKDEKVDKIKKSKKIKHKNLVLSIKKSNKFITISRFDLLTISAKSFTRRCAVYDTDYNNKRVKRKHIVFLPEAFYKSATESSTLDFDRDYGSPNIIYNNENLQGVPSLVRSLYNDSVNYTNTDNTVDCKVSIKDNSTMTDFNNPLDQFYKFDHGTVYSEIMKTRGYNQNIQNHNFQNTTLLSSCCEKGQSNFIFDFMNENLKSPNKEIEVFPKQSMLPRSSDVKAGNLKTKRNIKHRTRSKILKHKSVRNKRLTYLYKSPHRKSAENNYCDLINKCQSKFKYVSNETGNKNVKLEIEIKIIPTFNQDLTVETNNRDNYTVMSRQEATSDIEQSCAIVRDVQSNVISESVCYVQKCLKVQSSLVDNNQCIVPILDGAASQAQYIFKSDSCTSKSENTNIILTDNCTTTDDDILKDIDELKCTIRNLTIAAEAFIRRHLKKQAKEAFTSKTTSTLISLSRGVQYIDEVTKHPLPDIKLSKEPKNNISELYHRLMKKSTSYNIIASEAVLKITDMTSAANSRKSVKKLLRSKSLIEICNEKNRAVLTYFYKACQKPEARHIKVKDCYDNQLPLPTYSKKWDKKHCYRNGMCSLRCLDQGQVIQSYDENSICDKHMCDNNMSNNNMSDNDMCDNDVCDNRCAYYDSKDEEKGVCAETSQKTIGFGEGLVYCLLMWIPVLILFFLLYHYIIKDRIYPRNAAEDKHSNILRQNIQNKSHSLVKLSDLGF